MAQCFDMPLLLHLFLFTSLLSLFYGWDTMPSQIPFSDSLWIKDELLWKHSRSSCQNELVQHIFLWIIFHESFTTTLAVRGAQEPSPQISFFVIFDTFDYLSGLYSRLNTKWGGKGFLLLTFDKYQPLLQHLQGMLTRAQPWAHLTYPQQAVVDNRG